MIQIYTDGACSEQKVGGWAAIITDDGQKEVLKGREEGTTNNRMEVLAAIKGLEGVSQGAEVALHSDSQYLIYTMTRNWKRRANLDLWAILDGLTSSRRVEWHWIQGHLGHPGQEESHILADEMAGIREGESGAEERRGRTRMVDVGEKPVTRRRAVARGQVRMRASTLEMIRAGGLPKGDVLAAAQLAGIMAAKQTPHLLPLCHPLLLEDVQVEFQLNEEASAVEITASVVGAGKTGFEMEALTAVSVSALTIYDMAKGVDPAMRLEGIRLLRKSGGKSGTVEFES
ncbi:MAG: cyclic pyranopterin monophosphate synthase MoaC [Dehalococcoidia bacterium]